MCTKRYQVITSPHCRRFPAWLVYSLRCRVALLRAVTSCTSAKRQSRCIWTYGSLRVSFTVAWLLRPPSLPVSNVRRIHHVLVPRLFARSSSPSNPQRHTPVFGSSAFERPGRPLLLIVLMSLNPAFGNKSWCSRWTSHFDFFFFEWLSNLLLMVEK